MSQLKVNTIRHTGASSDAITLASDGTATAKITNNLSNRNLIINGGMEICQRYSVNSANNLSNATHTYHVDRFKAYSSAAAGILQAEWEDNNPSDAGFQYSVKYSCVQADTSLANDEMAFISQVVELKNMKHLGYGLSWAKTCTLSFYAKSSLTGTYAIALINDGTNNRQYVTEFTISDTNWNRYTITIPGDTSGTWSSNGLRVAWCLAAASNRQTSTLGSWQTSSTAYYGTSSTVNFMSSASSRSFSLTGVQLEVGDVATDFEHRSYGDELARCQRYYQEIHGGYGGGASSSSEIIYCTTYPVKMRATPTVGQTAAMTFEEPSDSDRNQSSTSVTIRSSRCSDTGCVVVLGNYDSIQKDQLYFQSCSQNSGGKVTYSAEL